jgi:hypothetical protein
MSKPSATVIKFPIGPVVREHRIAATRHGSPELDAIEQVAISVGGDRNPAGKRQS